MKNGYYEVKLRFETVVRKVLFRVLTRGFPAVRSHEKQVLRVTLFDKNTVTAAVFADLIKTGIRKILFGVVIRCVVYQPPEARQMLFSGICLLYTSDAADE